MPGVERLSVDLLLPLAERVLELGIPALALFPVTPPDCKTEDGRGGWNDGQPDVPGDPRRSSAGFPELGLIERRGARPLTTHGQDGLLRRRATSSTTRPSRR